MTATIDAQTLTDISLAHLPTDPASLRFSPVKTGKHNASFWVECDAGRFVLRIAPPDDAGLLFYERLMMRQEPRLHALIRANTPIPAAEVIGYDFSRRLIDRDYILLAALPGQPLSEVSGLTATQFSRTLHQVGEYLRQLHTLTATGCLDLNPTQYGYLGEHQPMPPQPDWGLAFELMWHKLLDDVVASGGYSHAEAQAMRDLLELHRHHFERPVTASLLHMDIWSQNILIDDAGNVTGLVDFDRALWGDVEIEYAVLDYCGISEPPFWQGYGSPRDESTPALIRRQFYLLYEIQKYIPILIWRRSDPAGAEQYKQRSFQLAAQLLPKR
ncbi:MAG: aminoglycoside phosphotransferase family protein [Anaerolineae bacterium]|nr:aminoglycoside phosphotransferase family protein [Anaerolineae bacterium]MCB9107232.1 aminoglycoside phosphotransferase family protein [Anaerolineales bacterium]